MLRPASVAQQRPADARLLVVDEAGYACDVPRTQLSKHLAPGDLVVVNDAATLPASLAGRHAATDAQIEVRLAAWDPAHPRDPRHFVAVIFGAGDFRTRTEDRPLPPAIGAGDRLMLGPLTAIVREVLAHPRLVALEFEGTAAQIWAGLARHGRPVQYAYVPTPLALYDVWTPMAAPPLAFEAPSASYAIDWRTRAALRRRGVPIAAISHAAGLSSTGDPGLDAMLPLPEMYEIGDVAARAIRATQARGGRVVAIGTTVVRALEHAARSGDIRAISAVADQRIGPDTTLGVVDALLTGVHEPGTSHYDLLRAFADDDSLQTMSESLASLRYRSHEFGDSVLLTGKRRHAARACR